MPGILLTIGVLCVSTAGILAKHALTEATPLSVAAWRLGLAALFFQIWGLWSRRRGDIPVTLTRTEQARLALAALMLAAHFLLWFASLNRTGVSIATLLVCTTPFWTAVFGLLIGRGASGLRFWLGFGIAIVGIVFVIHPQGHTAHAHEILGDILATAGGLTIGVYLLTVDGLQHIPAQQLVRTIYSGAALILWTVLLATGGVHIQYHQPVWIALVLLAVVPQIIGHTLLNNALRHFRADAVAFSILAEPVITAILAYFLLHEHLTLIQVGGGLLVLVALGIVMSAGKRVPVTVTEPGI